MTKKVDGGQIDVPVAIEIGGRDAQRGIAHHEVSRILERSVSNAIQNAECVAALVDHDQIGNSVAVDVGDMGCNR